LALWTFSLDLIGSSNRRRGVFMVHRLYSQRHLQLDINLLTSAFPMVLADALDRALQHTLRVLPTRIRMKDFLLRKPASAISGGNDFLGAPQINKRTPGIAHEGTRAGGLIEEKGGLKIKASR